MPITFKDRSETHGPKTIDPDSGDFFVSAGTVTVKNVEGMGSGFRKFKQYFGFNQNPKPDWVAALQNNLDAFHQSQSVMPAFQPVKSGDQLGGIATVPSINDGKNCDNAKAVDIQYKEAIQGAINGARTAGKPLYIQPLGIGVYGWGAEKAAELFADVIAQDEKDNPLSPLTIKIPIFLANADSSDQKFKKALGEEIRKKSLAQQQPIAPISMRSPSVSPPPANPPETPVAPAPETKASQPKPVSPTSSTIPPEIKKPVSAKSNAKVIRSPDWSPLCQDSCRL